MELQKPSRFKRRTSRKQKVWQFMRRNRAFRVGDLMVILEVKREFLKPLFWHLEEAGYLKLLQNDKDYKERIYQLVQDTGVKSPSIINGEVYDYNTGASVHIKRRGMARRHLEAMLKVLDEEKMSKQEIATRVYMNHKGGSAKLAFKNLVTEGVLVKTKPIERRKGEILFHVVSERRNLLLQERE